MPSRSQDAKTCLVRLAFTDGLFQMKKTKRGTDQWQCTILIPKSESLTPLEAVTLAVLERERHADRWWQSLAAHRSAIEEAHGILASLRLDAIAHRPTRELAYGQQRLLEISLALASKPRVLLLDEPAAGVPREESPALLQAIACLPGDISVLIIEHDMDLVFAFASRIVVLVGGSVMTEGTPQEIAADERVREVYLGRGRHAA